MKSPSKERRNGFDRNWPDFKETANITNKVFLSLSVRNSVLFMFWFRGGFLLLVLNSNVDGEYGYNVFNILVEVYILLETGS